MSRNSKKIDYEASPIGDEECLVRLLSSPLCYDKETNQVTVDAFDLRLLGRKEPYQEEQFASLSRRDLFADQSEFEAYLPIGFRIWDDKEGCDQQYYGHSTFVCGDAKAISPIIEIHPIKGNDPKHAGVFYVKSDTEYYRGPLPKDDDNILEVLTDLSALLVDVVLAPQRNEK